MNDSPISTLPRELRDEIFGYLVVPGEVVIIPVDSEHVETVVKNLEGKGKAKKRQVFEERTVGETVGKIQEAWAVSAYVALTEVCKQFRQECHELFFSRNTFVFTSNITVSHEPDSVQEVSVTLFKDAVDKWAAGIGPRATGLLRHVLYRVLERDARVIWHYSGLHACVPQLAFDAQSLADIIYDKTPSCTVSIMIALRYSAAMFEEAASRDVRIDLAKTTNHSGQLKDLMVGEMRRLKAAQSAGKLSLREYSSLQQQLHKARRTFELFVSHLYTDGQVK